MPPQRRNAKARSGPITAPAWSAARWKPKARPRIAGSTESAIRASRGAPRIPFPTRSVTRMASTCPADWARPIRGRIREAMP